MEIEAVNNTVDSPPPYERVAQSERREERLKSESANSAGETKESEESRDQVEISEKTRQSVETSKTDAASETPSVDRQTQEFTAQNWYAYGYPAAYDDSGTAE